MNILPLVITFLLIFGAISIGFLSNLHSDKKESESYIGSLRALRNLQNMHEDAEFERIAASDESLFETLGDDERSPIRYFRETRFESPKGRVNLYLLSKTSSQSKLLYQIASTYIHEVYKNMSSLDDKLRGDFATLVLDGIVTAQTKYYKSKKTYLKLEDIEFEDPELQHLYLKMLRGTNTYDLKKKEGYPSFLRLFSFIEDNAKPIYYQFASSPLLEAMFGKEIAKAIEEKEFEFQKEYTEKEKEFALSENSLKELIFSSHDKIPKTIELIDFSSFSKKDGPAQAYTDPKTNITRRSAL